MTAEEFSAMAKYVVCGLDGDPGTPFLTTVSSNTDIGLILPQIVGTGFPYWAFASLPLDILTADTLGADFASAPLCSDDAQTNRNDVAGLFASPPAIGSGGKVWKVA